LKNRPVTPLYTPHLFVFSLLFFVFALQYSQNKK
jgi:hypothetical protein